MYIEDIRFQHLICLQRILAALDKICKVKDTFKMISVKRLHQLQAPAGNIAVNLLFIFMEKDDILFHSIVHHTLHSGKYLFLILRWIFPFRYVKAEHADISYAPQLCQFHNMPVCLEMRFKVIGNLNLSDR